MLGKNQNINKEKVEVGRFTDLFETMAKQFIVLIESNNHLMVENMRLMKENGKLTREMIKGK